MRFSAGLFYDFRPPFFGQGINYDGLSKLVNDTLQDSVGSQWIYEFPDDGVKK